MERYENHHAGNGPFTRQLTVERQLYRIRNTTISRKPLPSWQALELEPMREKLALGIASI